VEARVSREMGENLLANRRRGMEDIWRSTERDSEEQQAFYSNKDLIEHCIIVDTSD
jgi:hypothetical protein